MSEAWVKATSSANKTLLHVIAEYVATSVPDASDFYESLNSLDEVSAISFKLLQNDVHMIEASLVQIDQEDAVQGFFGTWSDFCKTYKRVATENAAAKDKLSKQEAAKAKQDESKRDLFQQFTDSLEGDANDIVANYRSRHHKGGEGGVVGGLLRKDISRRRLSSTAGPATS
ncbi:hypothetical protein DYB35_003756 [Aphanomyces astaci]|uniref:FH2 domain-containing protein n=1 Tax=Aphanomyces astaci TaxID=112090 RepID=A0A418DGL1_APHAT|nr:hypothetical protein DYB35_003756 [Aphanomyces astaci]